MGRFSEPHICQCLTRIAALRRDSPVTIAGDRQRTGRQFVDGVLGLAGGMLRLGVSSGDVVAISSYNSDLYLEWLLAIAFVGGIAVPLNYRWSAQEARFAMLLVRPVMLVFDESCSSWSSMFHNNDIPSLRWRVSLNSLPQKSAEESNELTTGILKKHSARISPSNYFWAPEGAVIICFTSGTTGNPKGVALSHSALIIQSMAKVAICGYGESDVYLHTAPLCHIGGLSSALAMLMVGACHVLIPKFEATLAVEVIEKWNVTSMITVPTMVSDLLSVLGDNKSWKGRESLKKILNGGGSLSLELIKGASAVFPKAKIFSAYGMTEACSSMTFMILRDPTLHSSDESFRRRESGSHRQGICVGRPAPHVDLRTDTDDSLSVGKVLTRGPHLMIKYWNDPGSDHHDRQWFDTGDVGYIDESGNLWLIGRENGRIKTGGENVYPEEVEAVLLGHPGVAGAVTVGIPDARFTEMVVCCVRLREKWMWSDKSYGDSTEDKEHLLSGEILRQHCKDNSLTGFKTPKAFFLWGKPFPATSTGKIRRDRVLEEVMSRLRSFQSNL